MLIDVVSFFATTNGFTVPDRRQGFHILSHPIALVHLCLKMAEVRTHYTVRRGIPRNNREIKD